MASYQSIRAVLFDLDGTLRHNDPSSEHTFFDLAVHLGLPDSLDKRRAAMRWSHEYWAQSPILMDDLQTHGGLQESFWLNYARRHLISFECTPEQAGELCEEMQRLMSEHFHPQDLVFPDAVPTLVRLREAGYKLGVVSNRTTPFTEHLQTLGLDLYFDLVMAAGEVSSWKPEPEIFWHALEKLEVSPEQAVYVGDNYYADVVGSQRAGLLPVLLDPEGVFPQASCDVICSVGELLPLLGID